MPLKIDFHTAPDRPETREPEVLQSFNGGKIKIVAQYDEERKTTVEYLQVGKLFYRRRHPEDEGHLPLSTAIPEDFADLTIDEPTFILLEAGLKRWAIGQHTIFIGPPGYGKTRQVEFLAYLLNIPFYRVTCFQGMKAHDSFLWHFEITSGDGLPQPFLGSLPRAMQEGALILVDEIANLEPKERQLLLEPCERPNNQNMVSGRKPTLHLNDFPGKEKLIRAARGFFLVGTGNYAEGQGAGEIQAHTERDDRRMRPFLLDPLPLGIRAQRMVNRYKHVLADLPEGLPELVAQLYEEFDRVVSQNILPRVRQEPRVYLSEAVDRAFDHFMYMLLQEGKDYPIGNVYRTVQESLEFYYINAFRHDTVMATPTGPEMSMPGATVDIGNNRIKVRSYLLILIKYLCGHHQYQWRSEDSADTMAETFNAKMSAVICQALGIEMPEKPAAPVPAGVPPAASTTPPSNEGEGQDDDPPDDDAHPDQEPDDGADLPFGPMTPEDDEDLDPDEDDSDPPPPSHIIDPNNPPPPIDLDAILGTGANLNPGPTAATSPHAAPTPSTSAAESLHSKLSALEERFQSILPKLQDQDLWNKNK